MVVGPRLSGFLKFDMWPGGGGKKGTSMIEDMMLVSELWVVFRSVNVEVEKKQQAVLFKASVGF